MKILALDMGRMANLVRRTFPSLHEARLSYHKAEQLIAPSLTVLSSTTPLLSPHENPHNIRMTRDQRNEATHDNVQRVLLDIFWQSG
jgi:hypothetical protein